MKKKLNTGYKKLVMDENGYLQMTTFDTEDLFAANSSVTVKSSTQVTKTVSTKVVAFVKRIPSVVLRRVAA